MVSSLTRVAVSPCSKLTSAASSSVHRLVGLPKARGLWCNSSRRRSARGIVEGGMDRVGTARARTAAPPAPGH